MKAVSIRDLQPSDVYETTMFGEEYPWRYTFRVYDYFGRDEETEADAIGEGLSPATLLESVHHDYGFKPHFHPVDQFHVFPEGEGTLGKQQVKAYAFHYTDGGTPYGPILIHGEHDNMPLLVFRRAWRPPYADHTFPMPGSRERMIRKPGRNIVGTFDLDRGPANGSIKWETLEARHPDGLQVMGMRLGANAEAKGLNPAGTAGQYYIVASGTLLDGEKEMPKNSVIIVKPDEPAPTVRAGSEGANVLFLQFPRKENDEYEDVVRVPESTVQAV